MHFWHLNFKRKKTSESSEKNKKLAVNENFSATQALLNPAKFSSGFFHVHVVNEETQNQQADFNNIQALKK